MKRENIFVSYRRKDLKGNISGTDVARTIKQHLEIAGYKEHVFFDYSEISDEEFEHTILREIERSKVLILVLTHDTMYRCVDDYDWVRREILHAVKHNVKIIPVEVDNLFNGYPENLCQELNIIKRLHHSKVHMDSSFESDMNAIIEKRIKPVLKPIKAFNYKRLLIILLLVIFIGVVAAIVILRNNNEATLVATVESSNVAEDNSVDAQKICDQGWACYNDGDNAKAIEYFKEAAELGNAEAQTAIGYLYYEEGDFTTAEKWIRMAAENDFAEAEYLLGCMYKDGNGVEQSDIFAEAWWLLAEMKGSEDAQLALGTLYYEQGQYGLALTMLQRAANQGNVVAKDRFSQAIMRVRKDANMGHAKAQYELGHYYYQTDDLGSAKELLLKAAEQGYADAQFFLGGISYDLKDYDEAEMWARKAAEQGHAEAQYNLSILYSNGYGNPEHHNEALYWLEQSAKLNYGEAQYVLSLYYNEQGYNGLSLYWLSKAAEQMYKNAQEEFEEIFGTLQYRADRNDSEAQYALGCYYSNFDDDIDKCLELLHKAADEGEHVMAQADLGYYYLTQEDYANAKTYLHQAAIQGNSDARYNLGLYYHYIEESGDDAKRWFRLAANQGCTEAQQRLVEFGYSSI